MSNRFQVRKGNTAQNVAFTGAIGELSYDTEKKQLRVHDGSTVGGKIIDDTATETTAGKAKIATTAIAQAGVNDTDIMTPAKVGLVSFGQGQTRKSRTFVSDVEYTNTNNKPIIVGFSLRTSLSGNAVVAVTIKLGDITVPSSTFSGSNAYRAVYDFTILPQEKYTFTTGGSTFFDVAWEIS